MVVSSLATGLTHYTVFVKILRLIPEKAFYIPLTIVLIAAILTGLGSFIAVKYFIKPVFQLIAR